MQPTNILPKGYSVSAPDSSPVEPQQPVQSLYDQVTGALSSLRDEVAMLNERLGYVSLSEPCGIEECKDTPVPERSPMAHNLYCVLSEVNRISYTVQSMRNRLEI